MWSLPLKLDRVGGADHLERLNSEDLVRLNPVLGQVL